MKKNVASCAPVIVPVPGLIVSCRGRDGKNNALVVGFASNASIDPPMVMVGIMPKNHLHGIIKETGAFALNFPAEGFDKEYAYLGSKSGKDVDKFAALNLTWENGEKLDVPLLSACPVSVECRVTGSFVAGDHEFFIGSVEVVHCAEEYIGENGRVSWGKIPLRVQPV